MFVVTVVLVVAAGTAVLAATLYLIWIVARHSLQPQLKNRGIGLRVFVVLAIASIPITPVVLAASGASDRLAFAIIVTVTVTATGSAIAAVRARRP